MKITIITACYNAEQSIESTLLSVLNQTYDDIEYIVIDGKSKDRTVEIIKKYDSRITRWVSEPDMGLYDALNKGVRMATGEWIGILNCGDLFCSTDTIEKFFSKSIPTGVGVVYGNCYEVDKDKRNYKKFCTPIEPSQLPPDYRHGASFVRRNVHRDFLYATAESSKYGYALDYLQIYRMHKAGVVFYYIDVDVIDYEKVGISDNPWHNKYLRSLILNDGKKNLSFYITFLMFILKAIKNKMIKK